MGEVNDLSFEDYLTQENENPDDVVRRALNRGFQLIVAAGGDGAASAVAYTLANTTSLRQAQASYQL